MVAQIEVRQVQIDGNDCAFLQIFSQGVTAFADSPDPKSIPFEHRIAGELWKWTSLPESDRTSITSDQSELASLTEYYLCEVFQHKNSARSSSWWCDGAIGLSVSMTDNLSFLIVGAAYWAQGGLASSPFYLAPFELKYFFGECQDVNPQRIVVRFGSLDHTGDIQRTSYSANAWLLVQRRPTKNEDWAFAIELT